VSLPALTAMIVLLALNGMFVALEFSLVASSRPRLEQLAAGSRRYRRALAASGRIVDYIAGVQLGVTITSLGLGAVAEPVVARLLHNVFGLGGWLPHRVVTGASFALGFAIVIVLHSVFGELIPKNVAIADPERVLSRLVGPVTVFITVFRPVIVALDAAAGLGLRILRVERRRTLVSAHTADELGHLFAASRGEGLIGESEHRRLADAIEFASRPVRDVMVPRAQIVAAPRTATVVQAEQLLLTSGHSRLPVFERDLDQILGFVHVKDLLALDPTAADRVLPLRAIRRMLLIASARPLPEVLVAMRRSRLHVALVVDPEGRTAGLVTLEDLLEELVGDITDETDRTRP